MGFIITHREDGIYIGNCLGMGFWSNLENAGQDTVVVFETEEQAKEHIQSWDTNNNPDDYCYVEIETSDVHYATVDELKNAGLTHMLGELLVNSPSTMSIM